MYPPSWDIRRDYNERVCGIVLGEKEAGGAGEIESHLVAMIRIHSYVSSSRRCRRKDVSFVDRKKEFRES